MLKMAAFQQTSSATLPHHLTTHQLTHCSCLRPPIGGRLHPWFPKGLGSSIASMSLCTFMGGQKWPPSVTRQLDSGQRLVSIAIFPHLMIPQLSVLFFFFYMANSDRHFRSLYLSLFPSCYLLSSRSLNRLELSGSSYARSGQDPDHALSGTVQY